MKITADGEFTVDVSALSYVNSVFAAPEDDPVFGTDEARNAVAAIYHYYAAAIDLLGS